MKRKILRDNIYKIIEKKWPTYISEICDELKLSVNNKNIAKIKYHIKVLEKENKIRTKKIDRALVVWPISIEKLRVIRELVKI